MDQNEIERMHRKVMNSTLMEDEFFRACMRDNPQAIQLILRIILNDDKLVVKSMKTQEDMKDLFGKSSWFDVHAIDKNGRHLDIEIQNANEGADKRRARYYSSLMDANISEPGEGYDKVPDNIMIMITEKDVLKGKLPLYHIRRHIEETGELFEDGSHIIYVNGQHQEDDPIGLLMRDFHEIDANKIYYPELRDRIADFKNTEVGEGQVSEEFNKWLNEREAKGKAEGKDEMHNLLKRIKSGATNSMLLEEGYNQEDIDKARKLYEEIIS